MSAPISRELIKTLAEHRCNGPLLSLYLPTALEVDKRQQNEIRLKNLLREAEKKLVAIGMTEAGAGALTAAIRDPALNREIWRQHGEGFAIFAGAGFIRHVALPYPVRELAVTGHRFHLKPLFDALCRNRRFYLLALSRNDVSLYAGDGTSLSQIELGRNVPRSLTDVAGRRPAGKELHYHTGSRGGDVALYHGLGAGKDDVPAEVEQFVRAVSVALEPFWKLDNAPVIVAGVESVLAVYRQVSAYASRIAGEIAGNVEHMSENDLHEKAWPLVREGLDERMAQALYRLDHSDSGVPVSRELADVVRAAGDGRVETLFIAADRECWGCYDNDLNVATHDDAEPGDVDLLDRAAVDSWLQGGEVYAIPASEIPGHGVAIAELRY
jgi:hypothetical protein